MKNEFSKRREKARKLMNNKGVDALFLANAENIQYFTGVIEPSVHACSVVIIPRQSIPLLAVLWLDREAAQEQAEEISVEAYTPESQKSLIVKTLEQSGIAKGVIGVDGRAMARFGNSLKQCMPGTDIINASNDVEELRWIKSDEEIRLIKKACEISEKGMKTALESLKPGATELQIAAKAEHQMIDLGSDSMKHHPFVASGYRALLVHPLASQKKIADGDLVAIDLGAVYRGYCSDIARTAVVGKPNKDQINAFEILGEAQDEVCRKLHPGVSVKEIEESAQEIVGAAGYRLIGHVGHSIGLMVEEHPELMTTGTPYPDAKIEENMVVTFFQSAIQSKTNLGVRLEDTVLITNSGAKMLTNYPRELFT